MVLAAFVLLVSVAGGCALSNEGAGRGGTTRDAGSRGAGGAAAEPDAATADAECGGLGQAVAGQCQTPPSSACVDDVTVVEYGPFGACNEGRCVYNAYRAPCLGGCEDGTCQVCPPEAGMQVGPPGPRPGAERFCWSRDELRDGRPPSLRTLPDGGTPGILDECPGVDALAWGSPAGEGCGYVPVCARAIAIASEAPTACCYLASHECAP